ncbi:MAG: serine/threonine-protein phosphatase, partial [Burkholderiales bacterium]
MSALARLADHVPRTHLGALAFRAGAASHVGCVRKINEDAWLDRSEVGLWAVADGVGGHAAGDVASSEVISALNRVSDFSSAFAFRRNVRNSLFQANAALQRMAIRELLDTVGSTVVALIAHGGHYACTWAGDSRAYLLRKDVLTRITTDHGLASE